MSTSRTATMASSTFLTFCSKPSRSTLNSLPRRTLTSAPVASMEMKEASSSEKWGLRYSRSCWEKVSLSTWSVVHSQAQQGAGVTQCWCQAVHCTVQSPTVTSLPLHATMRHWEPWLSSVEMSMWLRLLEHLLFLPNVPLSGSSIR